MQGQYSFCRNFSSGRWLSTWHVLLEAEDLHPYWQFVWEFSRVFVRKSTKGILKVSRNECDVVTEPCTVWRVVVLGRVFSTEVGRGVTVTLAGLDLAILVALAPLVNFLNNSSKDMRKDTCSRIDL